MHSAAAAIYPDGIDSPNASYFYPSGHFLIVLTLTRQKYMCTRTYIGIRNRAKILFSLTDGHLTYFLAYLLIRSRVLGDWSPFNIETVRLMMNMFDTGM